ncbi:VIT1/CCC1 transporter family protein [Caballeronia grimmiae]|uniref:VIT1/CCC1 transporter family protein n=1 Tax=Caballeronia grimmiae TaxID=1071679 RepID=UPI0038BC299C
MVTALAGLIAGACSMALGEWLSVTNALELAQAQVLKKANELSTARSQKSMNWRLSGL